MRRLIFCLGFMASCGGGTSEMADTAMPADLATAADLAAAIDLAPAIDLAVAPDLSRPDLAVPPDLTPPADLAPPPDLVPPADLTPLPDLLPPPDLYGPPTLKDVVPPTGPSTGGGPPLTINGDHFADGAKVTINKIPATNVVVVSAQKITCTLPASPGTLGKVPVTVTNPDMTSATGMLFTYYYGAPSFKAHRVIQVGNNPRGMAVGEWSGDANLDLVAASCNSNNAHVLTGKGDGSFDVQAPLATGACAFSAAAADLDGVGLPDLLVGSQAGKSLAIFTAKGGGAFVQRTVLSFADIQPAALAPLDANGDGKLDLAIANKLGGLVVYYGDGAGALGNPRSNKVALLDGQALAVAQLNPMVDKIPDAVLLRESECRASVFLGNGTADWPANANPFAFQTGEDPSDIQLADLNGDGKLDLLVANSGMFATNCGGGVKDSVGVLLANGDGTFNPMLPYAAHQSPRALVVADFNGDGKPDVAVANNGSSDVSILIGRGDGKLNAPLHFGGGGAGAQGIVLGDFDKDGKPDVATIGSGTTPGTVTVWLNSST